MHSETDIEMAMTMSMDMGELGEQAVTAYYKDGWIYEEVMGMKIKMQLPIEEALKMANSDAFTALMFDESAVSYSSVKDIGGGKEFDFTLKGNMLSDLMSEVMGSMLDALGGEDMDITFGDMTYTVVLGSDNLPKNMHMVFSMDMQMAGESASASYDMNMTNLAYNNVSAIDAPADIDDYQEMSI